MEFFKTNSGQKFNKVLVLGIFEEREEFMSMNLLELWDILWIFDQLVKRESPDWG